MASEPNAIGTETYTLLPVPLARFDHEGKFYSAEAHIYEADIGRLGVGVQFVCWTGVDILAVLSKETLPPIFAGEVEEGIDYSDPDTDVQYAKILDYLRQIDEDELRDMLTDLMEQQGE